MIRHLNLRAISRTGVSDSLWRRISLASWRPLNDSTVVCFLDCDVSAIEARRLPDFTLTQYISWIIGKVYGENPRLNVVVRFGKIYARDILSVSILKAQGEEMWCETFYSPDRLSFADFSAKFRGQMRMVSAEPKKSSAYRMQKILGSLPYYLRVLAIRCARIWLYSLNLSLPFIKRDLFGSVMITSVGSVGVHSGIARIFTPASTPVMAVIGSARDLPVVRDGQVVASRVVTLTFSVDHRVIDAIQGAKFLARIKVLIDRGALHAEDFYG